MPRTYKKKPDKTRPYAHYTQPNSLAAARDVLTGKRSYRKAAEYHNVKKSTLVDFVKNGEKERNHGGQQIFTAAEEAELAKMVDAVAEWGFPLGRLEIRIMVLFEC